MSKELMRTALAATRKRFMDTAASYFGKDTAEHDVVLYRAKMLFDNTVLGGKNNRSLLSLATFDALRPQASGEERSVVAQAAATLEMVQAFYLIADDIMDESETRRGKPTWYKTPGIGLSAVNDAFLLDACAEEILRQLYPAHPQIERICDAYRRSKRMTIIGQMIDTSSQHKLKSFTWERYEQLVQHKTSHYTIFHPMEQALLICDALGGHVPLRKTAYELGFLFQAQDDVLDVFGDPAVTGKVGTDLKDGKCTWVTTRAIQKLQGQPELADFEAHFGKGDDASLTVIRQILDGLRVNDEFAMFQKHFSQKISQGVQQLPSDLAPVGEVIEDLLQRLVGRTK